MAAEAQPRGAFAHVVAAVEFTAEETVEQPRDATVDAVAPRISFALETYCYGIELTCPDAGASHIASSATTPAIATRSPIASWFTIAMVWCSASSDAVASPGRSRERTASS